MSVIDVPVEVTCTCRKCKKKTVLTVDLGDHMLYVSGALLIQDAFPYLTPAERELFITEVCGDCWSEAFKDIED